MIKLIKTKTAVTSRDERPATTTAIIANSARRNVGHFVMIRFLFFLSLALLFVACVPYENYPAELAAIDAQAVIDKATRVAAMTQEASIEATRVAEIDLAQRNRAAEKEIELLNQRAQERKEQLEAQQTEMAIWSAAATATAAPVATATAYAAALPAVEATQAAIVAETRVNEARAERARVSAWLIPIALTVAILWIAWKIGQYIDERIEIMRRKNSLMETRAGPAVWDWDAYQFILLQDIALKRRLAGGFSDFPQAEAVQLSPGKITATGPMDNGDSHKLVIDLVKDAIRVAGEESNVIPSHGELNWSGSRWMHAVETLKKLGAVQTVARKRTLVRYESLAALQYALDTGQLSPTPN